MKAGDHCMDICNFCLHLLFCRLLDRDIVEAEEVAVDDEEENGFLKAFKVSLPHTFLPLRLVFSGSMFTFRNSPKSLPLTFLLLIIGLIRCYVFACIQNFFSCFFSKILLSSCILGGKF